MSNELKIYLTEQVLALYDKAKETGEPAYRDMAAELNEVLNGVLEIKGTVS